MPTMLADEVDIDEALVRRPAPPGSAPRAPKSRHGSPTRSIVWMITQSSPRGPSDGMPVMRLIMCLVREPARSRNLFGHHPEDVARDDLFDAVPTGQMKPRGAGIGFDEEPVPDEGAAEAVESDGRNSASWAIVPGRACW